MIYDGKDILIDIGDGRELRYVLDGGVHKLDEDDLTNFMTHTYDTLAKDLYIYLSYDLYDHIGTKGELINKDEVNDYALKARETMVTIYKREFKDRMYRHYINQHFSDLEDDDILL